MHIHLKSERLHVHHNFRALMRFSRQEETRQWWPNGAREGQEKGKTRRMAQRGVCALYGASAEVCTVAHYHNGRHGIEKFQQHILNYSFSLPQRAGEVNERVRFCIISSCEMELCSEPNKGDVTAGVRK